MIIQNKRDINILTNKELLLYLARMAIFFSCLLQIHSNFYLAGVSVVAYAKWRLSFNVAECKQSGPYELLSTVRLTAAGKRITRYLCDEWKRVREMCPLAHTHVER